VAFIPSTFLIFTKIQLAMSYNQGLIAELQMEAASTRKLLERIPLDKSDWKPHEKSAKLGNLALHMAELPSWIHMIMTTDELDLATMSYKPTIPTTTAELLGRMEDAVAKAETALSNASDADFDKMWTLRKGDHVMFALPKKVVLRSFSYSHMVHHRGQLSVYLRLLDVPVPGMYGPSADDMAAMADMAAKN
jgi:uncharacterized damage-inducible protein DinB